MQSAYAILYLVFFAGATVLTVLRRRTMAYLIWPIVFMYPYAWIRNHLGLSLMGLHDFYVLGAGFLVLLDVRLLREGLAASDRSASVVLLLLAFWTLAHLWSSMQYLALYPDESWLSPIRTLVSDLRSFVPAAVAVAYLQDERRMKRALVVFSVCVGLAFLIVIGDRYGTTVADVFGHSTYFASEAMRRYRSIGGFGGPWEVGAVGAISIVFLLQLMLQKGYLNRVVGTVIVVFIGIGIAFSLSRSGIMSAAVGLVAVLALAGNRSRFRAIALVGIAIVILSNLEFGDDVRSVELSGMVEERMASAYRGGEVAGTAETRVVIWRHQLEYILSGGMSSVEMIFGLGGMAGAVRVFNATTHSGFLGPFVYHGLLGGILLLGTLGYLLLRGLVLWLRRSAPECLTLVGTTLVGMISNEFLSSQTTTYVLGFSIAVFSILLGRPIVQATPPVPAVVRPAPGPELKQPSGLERPA